MGVKKAGNTAIRSLISVKRISCGGKSNRSPLTMLQLY